MRILYISHTTELGGASIALRNIIEHVAELYDVGILMPSHTGWLIDELQSINCSLFFSDFEMMVYPTYCIRKHGWANPIGYLKFLKGIYNKLVKREKTKKVLARIFHDFKPDIVHCNCGPIDFSSVVCLRFGIPHVWHLREYSDLDFELHMMPSKNSFARKMAKEGNYCIAITKGIFHYFMLRPEIDMVIYDGVFDENLCVEGFKEYPEGNYFLSAGRIEQAKGTLSLIEAFAKFHKGNANYKLFMAGGYSDKTYLNMCKKACKELGVEEYVIFLGERNDVYSLMQHAKALIVSSPNEGFGFSAVEAMLNSCLVIGKNSAGTKEQFDNGLKITGEEIGLRFNTQEELIERMDQVACHNYDQNMKQRAFSVVVNCYTIQAHVKQLTDYYQRILKTSTH